jgi:CRP-like cAMP-binding protein
MDNSFFEALKQFTFLTLEDIKAIYSLAKIKSVAKGELLVKEGVINKNFFIIISGLLRTYVLTSRGEERTVRLTTEREISGSYASILLNKPSNEYVQALEPGTVAIIDSDKIDRLAKNHARLLQLQNTQLKNTLAETVERVHFFTVLSPEERLLDIQKNSPDLVQRVPQKYLASYIGVTTVSFSRIKARLSLNKK